MEPFENVSKLVSLADDIIHMKAICYACFKEASFSLKNSKSEDLVEIGGAELYKPCCRECFEKNKLFK